MNQLIIGALDLSLWFDAAGSEWSSLGYFKLRFHISIRKDYIESLRLIRYRALPLYCFYRSDFAFVHKIEYFQNINYPRLTNPGFHIIGLEEVFSGIIIEGSYHDAIPF